MSLSGDGSGTLILSGSGDFNGGTTVEEGTLVVASPNALESGSSLTVGNANDFLFARLAAGVSGEAASGEAGPVRR